MVPKVDLENVEEAFAYAAEIREHAPSLFERLETAQGPRDALEMLTYAEQLQKATTYLRPSARQAMRYALEVAFLAHRGQTRRSGQPLGHASCCSSLNPRGDAHGPRRRRIWFVARHGGRHGHDLSRSGGHVWS